MRVPLPRRPFRERAISLRPQRVDAASIAKHLHHIMDVVVTGDAARTSVNESNMAHSLQYRYAEPRVGGQLCAR